VARDPPRADAPCAPPRLHTQSAGRRLCPAMFSASSRDDPHDDCFSGNPLGVREGGGGWRCARRRSGRRALRREGAAAVAHCRRRASLQTVGVSVDLSGGRGSDTLTSVNDALATGRSAPVRRIPVVGFIATCGVRDRGPSHRSPARLGSRGTAAARARRAGRPRGPMRNGRCEISRSGASAVCGPGD
jgi:hypothetical protein